MIISNSTLQKKFGTFQFTAITNYFNECTECTSLSMLFFMCGLAWHWRCSKTRRENMRPSPQRHSDSLRLGYSLHSTMQWDCRWEYVYLCREEGGWGGLDRLPERWIERLRKQMLLARNTQDLSHWSTRYLSLTVSFSKPFYANMHSKPPSVWVSTLFS